MNDAPAAKKLLQKHSNSPPSAETQEQEGTKNIAKEDEDEDEEEEDEDEEDTRDEDEDADEDEDSDQGDEEASCGAAGEEKGVGDGKSDADVLIVGEEKAQNHKEDGKESEPLRRERCSSCDKSQNHNPFNRTSVVCLKVPAGCCQNRQEKENYGTSCHGSTASRSKVHESLTSRVRHLLSVYRNSLEAKAGTRAPFLEICVHSCHNSQCVHSRSSYLSLPFSHQYLPLHDRQYL